MLVLPEYSFITHQGCIPPPLPWGVRDTPNGVSASGTAVGQEMDALCLSSRLVALGTDPSFPRRQKGMWVYSSLQAGTLKPAAALHASYSSCCRQRHQELWARSSSLLSPEVGSGAWFSFVSGLGEGR